MHQRFWLLIPGLILALIVIWLGCKPADPPIGKRDWHVKNMEQANSIPLLGKIRKSANSVLLNTLVAKSRKKPNMPLVHSDVAMDALSLNSAQIAKVEELREKFWEDLGAGALDLHSSEYLQRWRYAQPANDQLLKTVLGQQVFQDYQRLARMAEK